MLTPIVRSLFVIACLASVATAAAPKPNFLFVIADDCTFRDIGCYGGQAYTPNIDRLATEGMKFNQCFQSAPMCSPTRHNIYTGLYPVKSGAYPNHTFAKDGTKSVIHYLKPLGYRVALSGKKHIAPQEVFPFEYSADANNPDFKAIDTLMGECKESQTPFCVFACSNEPHSPWNKGDASKYPPEKVKLPPYFVDTKETRQNMSKYLAEITYYDWQVGECLKLLDKHGVAENTMVIVVSEQGSGFPFGKWTCYDTGLQSACIARWPGQIEPGSVSDALIEYIDMLPTFVTAAGGKPAAALQGQSLLPVFRGEKNRHKEFVFGEMTTRGIINGSPYYGIRSIRSDKFKYILNFTPDVTFTNACTKSVAFQSWKEKADSGDADAAEKVRRYHHRPAEELYAISDDTFEWNNLADDPKFAEVKAELRNNLDAWMLAQGDEGQETELAALDHQGRNRKKNKGETSMKNRKKKANKSAP
ncbi:MAG: sulfatase [Planctomycetes bacterium]|nr:sulfatase [Planctomycetota bacterium]